MTVAQPTTAAQYFHLLRAQAHRGTRRPLVVMTPKSLLRARQARSPVEQLVDGRWREVLDDEASTGRRCERVVLCSGKVAYEAMARRDRIVEAGRRTDRRRPRRAALPLARAADLGPAGRLPRRYRGRLAPGGAGEHGRLDVRPRAPAPLLGAGTRCAT